MQRLSLGVLSLIGLAHGLTDGLHAQCTTPWLPGSTLTNGAIHALAVTANGDVIAGGAFTQIEGVAANYVARWNGTTWSTLGTGTDAQVTCVCVLQNGDILAGGRFQNAGGLPAKNIARWNGSSWSALGTGWDSLPVGGVASLLETQDGTIVAGGYRNAGGPLTVIAHAQTWNGAAWTTIPFSTVFGSLSALAELPNGQVLIGGAGISGLRVWDGTLLSTWVTGGQVDVLRWTPTGTLVIGGQFTSIGFVAANRIATWNGTSISPLGTGTSGGVLAIDVLPDGDLVVGGNFATAGGVGTNNLARWDGTSWSAFGAGVQGVSTTFPPPIAALAFPPAGPLSVGGAFTQAGGVPTDNLARVGTTCPVSSQVFGYGCGTNTLAVTSPAWANGVFRADGTGLPASSIVLTITSVTPVMPGLGMDAVYAIGVPGCDLFVAPDILGVLFTSPTGTAASTFFLPDTPPIVGVTFYHQMIPWEITNGLFTAITATNALQLTAGAF